MTNPSPLSQLHRRRLIVVTGKGGVGKTTVAAVLGRLLARSGRKTLVIEVDPRENVHRLLGRDPSGGAIVSAGRPEVRERLRAWRERQTAEVLAHPDPRP